MHLTGQIVGMPPEFAGAFGFVGAPLDLVADELYTWHTELGFQPRRSEVSGGLSQSAVLLLPLAATPYGRTLLVGTRSAEWTAYFDASLRGGDPRGAVAVLGRRLKAAHVVIYSIPFQNDPDAIPNTLGAVQWEYSPDGSSTNQRAIALVEGESSSRLHFEEWGPIQEWETPDAYTARAVRSRLTGEMVDAYCRAIGIEPFDPAFYSGPSVLIERTA